MLTNEKEMRIMKRVEGFSDIKYQRENDKATKKACFNELSRNITDPKMGQEDLNANKGKATD